MEYFEVAAKWWTDQIRNHEINKLNTSPSALDGGIVLLHETINKQVYNPTDKDYDYFYSLLADYIKQTIESFGSNIIVSDYGPEESLCAIANQASIPFARFPWKVRMYISKNEVIVYQGTGSHGQIIYPE